MSESDEPASRGEPAWKEALAFAAVYLIWGSTYLAIRVAVRSLPPFLMAGSRFAIAGGVLYAWTRASGVAAPTGTQWLRGALAGIIMLAGGNGLVTWAETRLPSNVAALLVAAVPLHVALLDWARPGGTRPRPLVWAGIAVGAIGMAILVVPDPHALVAPDAAAVLAMLISGLAWAAGSLYARYGGMHPQPLMASAQQMLGGGVFLLLIAAVRGERIVSAELVPEALGAFAYLTIFGSLAAFSAFAWLVKESTPARLSTTAFVNPVVAVVLGWLLLDEALAPRSLLGAGFIVAAVAVMTLGSRKRQPRAQLAPRSTPSLRASA